MEFGLGGKWQAPSIDDGDCLLIATGDGGPVTIPLMVRLSRDGFTGSPFPSFPQSSLTLAMIPSPVGPGDREIPDQEEIRQLRHPGGAVLVPRFLVREFLCRILVPAHRDLLMTT